MTFKLHQGSNQSGFTFTELAVTLVLFTVMSAIAISTFVSTSALGTSKVNTEADTILSDLRSQQIKAMSGLKTGTAPVGPYGVKFNTNEYILFQGATYADASNEFSIAAQGLEYTTAFPDEQIVFASGSGEIINFNSGQNTVTITKTDTSIDEVLTFNNYGVLTARN